MNQKIKDFPLLALIEDLKHLMVLFLIKNLEMKIDHLNKYFEIWDLISDDEGDEKLLDYKYKRYLKKKHLKRK